MARCNWLWAALVAKRCHPKVGYENRSRACLHAPRLLWVSLGVDSDGPAACTEALRLQGLLGAEQVPCRCGSNRQSAEVKRSSCLLLPKLQKSLELLQLRLRAWDGSAALILHNAGSAYAAVCTLLGLPWLGPTKARQAHQAVHLLRLHSSADPATPSAAAVSRPHDEAVLLPAFCGKRTLAGLEFVEGAAGRSLLPVAQCALLDCLPPGSPKSKASASRTALFFSHPARGWNGCVKCVNTMPDGRTRRDVHVSCKPKLTLASCSCQSPCKKTCLT